MTDIQFWEDNLTEEVNNIGKLLDSVLSLSDPAERASTLEEVEERLQDAQGKKRHFNLEIRLVHDVKERRMFEGRLRKMDRELRTLHAGLLALQAKEARGELFASSRGPGGGDNEGQQDPTEAGSHMLEEAAALQEKTQNSLTNAMRMITSAEEEGLKTLTELHRQTEVIQSIEKDTDKTDQKLTRTNKLLKRLSWWACVRYRSS